MIAQNRIRSIGWIVLLAICTGFYLLLHLRVHAVNSDIIRAERHIVALEQEKLLLETEVQTRANQLQLAAWNRVDFGYTAPTAAQFLDGERKLAALGTPRAPGSPEPILVAHADPLESAPAFAELVAADTPEAEAETRFAELDIADDARSTAQRTGQVLVAAALSRARLSPAFGDASFNETTTRIPLAAMVRVAAE